MSARTVNRRESKIKIMMNCYCGHDCSKCFVYLASNGDPEFVSRAQDFYKKEFGLEIDPNDLHCDGGRAEDERIFRLCLACPFRKCCREKGIDSCGECGKPCAEFEAYRAKYVNRVGQI